MFSLIRRRNWQENQQKTSAAIGAQCTRCKEHENEIKTLKENLLTAKSANNERIQDLQNHVESLVFQNENLLKTIQKLVCQSTTSSKPTAKVPVVELNKLDVKVATGLKLENKEKNENATKKILLDKGKTGVVGPHIKNRVIKGKTKNKFGNKVVVKKGNIGPKTTAKVKAENKIKVENTGKTTPQLPFPGLGKEVKIVVRKLECEVSGQFLYIGKKNQDNNKNVNCESSDEEVDVERLISSSSSSSSSDDSDDEVPNNGVRSNKPIASQRGDQRTAMKCLWHDPGKLVCHKEFKSSSELGIHVRRVHVPFKGMNVKCYWQNCVRQGRPFNRRDALKNHMCIHTGLKQFVCKVPECGKAFIKKYDCQHHICFPRSRVMKQRAHLPPSSNPSSTQSYPVTTTHQVVRTSLKHHWCRFPRCGKKFATSKSLKQHQDNVHCPAEKRFRCATCSKTFLHGGDLERHEMLHRQKSFACPNCEKSFYDVQSLRSHRRSVHLEEKRYRCMHPDCSKMLASSAALQKHVQTHTGQQPFRCSYPTCATRFTDKGALKKHLLRVHTGNKKRCLLEGCNEHFASRLLCVEHQLLVHAGSFTNPHVTNGEPAVTEIDHHDAPYEQETNFVEPTAEKDNSYDIDIKYERSVQPEWDNFYGVKVKLEKPDAEESYDGTQVNYEDPYDMEEVNYEKSMPEDADDYDMELVNNGGYSDVTNGVADENDTNDSIVVVDDPEPVVAVPDIWFV